MNGPFKVLYVTMTVVIGLLIDQVELWIITTVMSCGLSIALTWLAVKYQQTCSELADMYRDMRHNILYDRKAHAEGVAEQLTRVTGQEHVIIIRPDSVRYQVVPTATLNDSPTKESM